ncbi:hypothetical protein NM001_001406 [Vibrio vulnificus]|nr:hypothetical protein [Vibrio vulnificus]
MKYLILLLIFLGSGLAQAEIFVVVSHESSIHQMKQSDVADIYLGRKRIFGQVEITQVLDREDDVRERFFIRIANMRASQINAYWAKLKFSGRVRAPHLVETDEELLSHLLSNPNAIGYMQTLPPDELKVVVTINE